MRVLVFVGVGLAVGLAMRPLLVRFEVRVPPLLPATELACAVLFGLAAHEYGNSWRLAPVLVMAATYVALSVVDLVHYRLPNAVLFPALAASVVLVGAGETIDGDSSAIVHLAIGALVYSGVLLVIHLSSPAGLGFGDVKLALMLGAFLGWVSGGRLDAVRAVMIGLLVGSVLGLVLGLARMAVVRLGGRFLTDPVESSSSRWHKTTFPFGPPLMLAATAIVLWPANFLG